MRLALVAFFIAFMIAGAPSNGIAITPEEQLSDPKLEQRARALSAQLRCLVCQNQSIEDSDADLAKDLRREVRRQLIDGKSDTAILSNLQATYGNYILLRPPVTSSTYLLWFAPILCVLIAFALFWQARRTKGATSQSKAPSPAIETQVAAAPPISWPAISVVIAIIMALSVGVYSQLGRPDLSAMPAIERAAERAALAQQETASLQEKQSLFAKAKTAAEQNQTSVEAQLSLAFAASQIDDFDSEIAALRRALPLTNDAPAIKAMLAEAFSRASDGQITLPARELIAEVLQEQPNEPRALFMAGLAAYQDEDFEASIRLWTELQKTAPAGSMWQDVARRNIAFAADQAGLQIDAEAVEDIATASEDEQVALISAMVDGLEMRLQEAPDDRAGWRRLVQARRVQQDEEGLYRALEGAAASFVTDRDFQLDLLEFLLTRPLRDSDFAKADVALQRLSQIDDAALEYLFFAGYFAKQKQDIARATAFWQQLYETLPDGDPFKEELRADIMALR